MLQSERFTGFIIMLSCVPSKAHYPMALTDLRSLVVHAFDFEFGGSGLLLIYYTRNALCQVWVLSH